jgi:hypothetical protein
MGSKVFEVSQRGAARRGRPNEEVQCLCGFGFGRGVEGLESGVLAFAIDGAMKDATI